MDQSIESMAKAIEVGFTPIDKVIDSVVRYRALKLSRDTMLRLYYFEVCNNLELLHVLAKKFESDETSKLVNNPTVITMLSNLEVQTAYAILFSNDAVSRKLFKFLSDYSKSSEKDKTKIKWKKSVLEAIMFTVKRIIILQKLSSFNDEQSKDMIENLRVKVRFDNIRANLQFIRKVIKDINKKEEGNIFGYIDKDKPVQQLEPSCK
jgi:hypothetical protein